jgi:hypothetical protein
VGCCRYDPGERKGVMTSHANWCARGQSEKQEAEVPRKTIPVSRLGTASLEESEVNLHDGLKKAHIGALVEANLVLPEIDEDHLGARQRK